MAFILGCRYCIVHGMDVTWEEFNRYLVAYSLEEIGRERWLTCPTLIYKIFISPSISTLEDLVILPSSDPSSCCLFLIYYQLLSVAVGILSPFFQTPRIAQGFGHISNQGTTSWYFELHQHRRASQVRALGEAGSIQVLLTIFLSAVFLQGARRA